MFTALSEQLGAIARRLTGRGVLSEQDVTEALREIDLGLSGTLILRFCDLSFSGPV